MSDVTVRGCRSCPVRDCDWCDHPACTNEEDALTEEQILGKVPPPTWCPLRAGPLVVRLEVRDA